MIHHSTDDEDMVNLEESLGNDLLKHLEESLIDLEITSPTFAKWYAEKTPGKFTLNYDLLTETAPKIPCDSKTTVETAFLQQHKSDILLRPDNTFFFDKPTPTLKFGKFFKNNFNNNNLVEAVGPDKVEAVGPAPPFAASSPLNMLPAMYNRPKSNVNFPLFEQAVERDHFGNLQIFQHSSIIAANSEFRPSSASLAHALNDNIGSGMFVDCKKDARKKGGFMRGLPLLLEENKRNYTDSNRLADSEVELQMIFNKLQPKKRQDGLTGRDGNSDDKHDFQEEEPFEKRGKCRYFLAGRCKQSKKCRFDHF